MSTTDSTTGTILGDRYLLTRPLGAGASATVYLAEDQSLRREVAVKVLRSGLAADTGFQRRFRAEAVAAAGLNHPHVLSVFDWGEANGEAWLVTEYLAGGSLRDLLDQRGRLVVEQVVSIGAQAADGLAYAHSRGFVHRDVKPANLLFDDAGRVRIADFGVARALAEAAWTEPTGGLIGTVRYASPEQAQGLPVDGKADVYSLALVLYECLTGEVPFTADSQVATLHARIGAVLPDHALLGPLAGVLRAAAAPEPASRLDAAALSARLTELARTLPDPAPLRTPRPVPTIGFHPPTPEELTGQHRVGAASRQLSAAAATPTVVAAADLTEVGPAPAADVTVVAEARARETAVNPDLDERDAPAARRRRRWPAALLVAVLLVGGATGAYIATRRAPVVTFRVPDVVGMSVPTVRGELGGHHVTVVVDRRVTSKTIGTSDVVAQRPRPGTVMREGATMHVIESSGPPPTAVPLVVGMSCHGAVAKLVSAGFSATCPAALAVYSPSVAAGQTIAVYQGNSPNPSTAPFGAALAVQLSKGRPPVPLPGVVGISETSAVAALQRAGFSPVVAHAFSHTVPAGTVITTRPGPRVPVQPGGSVTVVVSEGVPVAVPVLGHVSLARAEQIVLEAGLTVLSVHGPANSQQWTTQPAPGTLVAKGSSVALYSQ